MFGIARKLVLRQVERGRSDVVLDEENDDGALPELAMNDDPLLDLTHREGIDALRRAVQALPRRYREVVVLCDLEEVDYADAAVALGCPIGTVRSRLHRARGAVVGEVETRSKSPAGGDPAQSGEVHIMNCQEFWNTMPEPASTHPHLKECAAVSRALQRAGRTFGRTAGAGGGMARTEAPSRVEARLLHGVPRADGQSRSRPRRRRWIPAATWAAAIAAMIAAGVFLVRDRAPAEVERPAPRTVEMALMETTPTGLESRARRRLICCCRGRPNWAGR